MSRFIVTKQDTSADVKGYFGAEGNVAQEPPKNTDNL
jgi:hypothetical protein